MTRKWIESFSKRLKITENFWFQKNIITSDIYIFFSWKRLYNVRNQFRPWRKASRDFTAQIFWLWEKQETKMCLHRGLTFQFKQSNFLAKQLINLLCNDASTYMPPVWCENTPDPSASNNKVAKIKFQQFLKHFPEW